MHAKLLVDQGGYEDVRVAFLKEDPLVDNCLDGVESKRVVIVPDFLAEGYFTRQIIPTKLKLAEQSGVVTYAPPVGTHPMMGDLLEEAAKSLLGDWSMKETGLLVIGHGSGKNPCSKQTLLHHLQEIRQRSEWGQVQDLWLEEAPRVTDWRDVAVLKQLIVIPYLLNDGQHGGWDIPEDLGLAEGVCVHGVTHDLDGLEVRVAHALGTSRRFADAIAAIASLWGGSLK